MITLEITDDNDSGYLSFDLADILIVFGKDGLFQEWRIESLEAVAKPSSGLDVLELERQVKAVNGGLVISWTDLQNISKSIFQTINGKFTGSSGACIEAQDSSRWLVSCQNSEIASRIRARFERVKEVEE